MLEKNFDEYIVEIMSLEDQLRMKDRIISRLMSQTVANCLEPYLERTPERDTESKSSLKSAKWFEIESKTTADETESSCVSELQSQLTDIQDQLHQKDEAFNYVRAKYSATVARLKLKVETKERHYAKADMDVYFI
jgi:molecular chaperone GrpE (heat shock protein)